MWKRCNWNGKEYLVKHTVKETLHELYVTDLVYLWHEEIGEDSLLQRCKDMNRLLETSDAELLNLVLSLVDGDGDNVTSCFNDIVDGKQLNLQTDLDGLLKFKIKFMLHLADHKKFFERVCCPLLVTISELEKRNKLLIDIIKKKDLEITEYKLERGKISRDAVVTEVFDAEGFSRNCDEALGITKGLVQSHPICTFTPFITDLLRNTENSLEIIQRETQEVLKRSPKSCKNMGRVKLKSPIKPKKPKIYEDEDEISDETKEEIKEESENSSTACVDHKKEPKLKPPKSVVRPKVKNVLSNL